MKRHFSMGLAMLASAAFGAIAVNGPHAQNKAPGAYVVIDISAINNPEMFKTLLPKIAPSNAAFGGQNIAATENIVALEGTPPKRFAIVSFDSIDKAKAWNGSAATKEINDIRTKSATSRTFIVEGM